MICLLIHKATRTSSSEINFPDSSVAGVTRCTCRLYTGSMLRCQIKILINNDVKTYLQGIKQKVCDVA